MPSGSKYDRTTSSSVYDVFSPNAREFQVPKFQRNYSWGDDKVEPLWSDFLETFQDYLTTSDPLAAQYLLGPVVFVKINNKFLVIDGQQRLATLTILFCLARDLIIDIKKPGAGETPHGLSELIKVTENQRMDQHQNWKLVLNDSDKGMLEEIQTYERDVTSPNYKSPDEKIKDWNERIKNPTTRDDFTDSMKKIIGAYELLLKKMKDALYTGFESESEVEEVLAQLEENANKTVAEKMKADPEEFGLPPTFFDDLQKLTDRDFSDEEKREYERKRERQNRTTMRYPTLDSYIERLITRQIQKLKNLKKQEIINEENRLTRETMKNNLTKFLPFVTHVLENNFLVEIVVDDDEDAFQIFETLNERGLPLSKSNLIKNHIIFKMDSVAAQGEISNEWNEIFDDIIGTDQGDDDFIRESLRSRFFDKHDVSGKTVKASKKSLYKIIKSRIQNEQDAKKFVSDLRADSKFVKLLNDPSRYPDGDTKDATVAIKALGGDHIRVPIITAFREWGIESDEYKKLVNFLVKFFFRFRIVCGEHPGEVDKTMIDCASKIKDGESAEEITNFLKEKDDAVTFEWNFENNFEPKSEQVANYVLTEITLHLGSQNSDVRPVGKLTVEHILPKKPEKSEWKSFFDNYQGPTQQKTGKFTYKIGNQTLLTQPINSAVSNNGFDKKKNYEKNGQAKGYNSSELEINKQTVMTYDEWTATIVEERCQTFAQYAKEIWSLD